MSDFMRPSVLQENYGTTYKVVDNTNMTDAYWLRVYAGQTMQGMLSCSADFDTGGDLSPFEGYAVLAVRYAQALLAEVKKYEANNVATNKNSTIQ